jgi:anti-sigma factor RsiW
MKTSKPTAVEAQLRAYMDGALAGDELVRVEHLLTQSNAARTTLNRLRQEAATAQAGLSTLQPPETAYSPASQALIRFQTDLSQKNSTQSSDLIAWNRLKGLNIMLNHAFVKRYQSAITAVALVLTLIVAFSFAPVRAVAGDLLKIFRVQQVKVIQVDTDNFREDGEIGQLLEQVAPDSRVVVDGGKPVEVASLEEAAAHAGYTPAEIRALPADAGERVMIKVQDKSVNEVKVDLEIARAVFDAAKISVSLPDSLEDTPIIITRPTLVMQTWGNADKPTLSLAQMESPQIEYPDDLDLNTLGTAGLQLLGYSEAEAKALADTIDWTNTLLFPVPSDADVEVSEVSINGGSGVLFTKPDEEESGVMWQKDGKSYFLLGQYSADQILQAAESVR